jgi:hypothetical protein
MADIRPVTKVEGPDASDTTITQNPVVIGGRSSDAVVTPVTGDGENVALWVSRRGALFIAEIPHVSLDGAPFTQLNKTLQQGGAATGVAIWTPGSGKKICVTSYDITVVGTAASDVTLWFGASGDTTYTLGTDYAMFYSSFVPSATISPGASRSGTWVSPTADHILRITAPGANTYYINVHGYEF